MNARNDLPLCRRDFLHIMATLALAGANQSLWAADRKGPLAELPAQPGPHVARIRDLPENTWLELGPPDADPKWGRARGRSWMSEMPFAPELRGAFLFGEGVHGYAKPDGHYMDDLWFYDINGHRWICCYPGANTKTLELKINADGFEADASGQLIPVAQEVHGYQMNTYDTKLKRFMSMPNTHTYWDKALPQRKNWLARAPADASPWLYESTTGQWQRFRTATSAPSSGHGDVLIYLADRNEAFFAHRSQEIWFYEIKNNKWRKMAPQGPKPPFGIDATACYDPKRQRIYMGGGSYPVAPKETHGFWTYDLKTDQFVDLKPSGSPCKGSNSYPTKNAVMIYEPHHDVVLLAFHSAHDDNPDRIGIYVYDPVANSWQAEPLALPEKLGRNRQAKNGFYDAELNALFIHSAGDSQDNSTIWVYRYKSKA